MGAASYSKFGPALHTAAVSSKQLGWFNSPLDSGGDCGLIPHPTAAAAANKNGEGGVNLGGGQRLGDLTPQNRSCIWFSLWDLGCTCRVDCLVLASVRLDL